jgi:hypothetical protein
MAQYVEVPGDTVAPDVRIAAEKGVEFAKKQLGLPDIGIRWFDFAPPEATMAWFSSSKPIFGTTNQEQLDHIRLWAKQGPPKAGETAAHESFHISSALDRRAKGLPMLFNDDPVENAGAVAFTQRYLDELGAT